MTGVGFRLYFASGLLMTVTGAKPSKANGHAAGINHMLLLYPLGSRAQLAESRFQWSVSVLS